MPATIRVNRHGETMKGVYFFIEMPWYEKLVKLAQKDDRTVTNLTAVAVKEYIQKNEKGE